MSNSNNHNSHVPKLRFPGFDGEWEDLPLSNYLFEHKSKSDGKCEVHSVSVSKGVINQVEYLGRSFAAADTSKYNMVKPNDIIYTKSPTGAFPYGIIKQNKNPYNVIVSPLYAVYTPTNKYVGYILDSYFESPERTNNYLSSLVQKGAKNTIQISNDTFISKLICLPSNPAEQQKIAECLTEMDNLISAQAQKVELLKTHKKGLMQQLFPQPGETIPRLRFPGFEGDWVKKKLGMICDFVRGPFGGALKKNIFVSSGYAIYEQQHAIYGQWKFRYYIDPEKFEQMKRFEVHSGDILMSCSGTMGKTTIVPDNCTPGIINQALLKLSVKSSVSNRFIKNFIDGSWFQEGLNTKTAGGAIQNIASVAILKELEILLPTLPEQQKIINCLSKLDDLITSESAKLESLKAHKKGLMQQLFPEPIK